MKDFKSFHSAFQTLVKALLAVSLLHLALFSESEHPPLSPHTKKVSARVLKFTLSFVLGGVGNCVIAVIFSPFVCFNAFKSCLNSL